MDSRRSITAIKKGFKLKKIYLTIGYGTLLFLLLTAALTGCSRDLPDIGIEVNGRAALIADAGSGKVLFAKNPEARFPPASTTKVMTAIVALENLSPDAEIVPRPSVVQVEPTIAGLKAGVSYELKDLLSAILIKSANDAAVVIAQAVAGSEKDFAAMMNEKAERIGMENTYFATASGLPTGRKDSQYTTVSDLARMMRYALRYDIILREMSKKSENIYGSDERRIYLKTHNKTLIRDGDEAPWGKTGYTREARRTFVGVDPSERPRIVFSLLRSNDLWEDIRVLKNKGLQLHELSRENIFSDILNWVSRQRKRGRRHADILSG
ncbi:MAG: hypothetical protein GF392_03520 [Candidatus Omnitrophica bacterium]|nr:hypothetical protein [Candidatus Omnitrophota bacterium]